MKFVRNFRELYFSNKDVCYIWWAPCVDGHTFSLAGETVCNVCTTCDAAGEIIGTACTRTANTVCGNVLYSTRSISLYVKPVIWLQ